MYEGRTSVEEGKILGHENVGVIEAVGPGQPDQGRRPVSVPFNIACDTCRICGSGRLRILLTGDKAVDTTGGGDAFTAVSTAALLRQLPYEQAGHLATTAAGATVSHRPHLHRRTESRD